VFGKFVGGAVLAVLMGMCPAAAYAWGDLGHEITGVIAYAHLSAAAKAKVDQILAADHDTLTAPDFSSRATWADKYRNGHRETADWHFVDIEIDHPDLAAACFGFPQLSPGQLASQGPPKDCVVDKIEEFSAELKNPSTPAAEQAMALKFLIHFVGDLHQPLHAADHSDRGGNCVMLQPSGDFRSNNLHAYWDTGVLQALGDSPVDVAMRLDRDISPAQAKAWSTGDPKAWAMESFALAKSTAYALPSLPTCGQSASVTLSPAYEAAAQKVAATQLEKAGVRIALVLNRALGS